ncbi:ABC transporter transmembrane domain-containing protein [Ruminiclostridium josui]|uniref:ABC transporter transmembrane domain-containing protein n=1 Tax=Ruminiclostridium josui TaxID=1499 RepID=UPI0006CF7042|nr:ABC transporter ATP-binding protein [Ruminiclostridium josui]
MEHKNTFEILKENYKVVLRLFRYSRGFRKSYIAALIINAFTMIRFSFVIGFSVQWVTDSAINRNWEEFEKAAWFAVIAFVINSILYFFEGYLMQTRVEMIVTKVKSELLDKVMHISSEYHDSKHSGELQSRLTNDLAAVSNAISFTLVDPINFMVLGIVNLILIALISLKMAFICIILVISIIILNFVFLKRIQQSSSKIQSTISAATERFSDIINGISIIKIFNLQNWIYNRYDNESKKILFWQSKLINASSIQKSMNGMVENMCNVGVIGIGALLLAQGDFTPGALLAIFRYVSKLVFAFTGFGWVLSEISKSMVGASRVMEILDLPEEDLNGSDIKPDYSKNDVLEFKDVTFTYGNEAKVIVSFSAQIKKGEKVAIVGPSGQGRQLFSN